MPAQPPDMVLDATVRLYSALNTVLQATFRKFQGNTWGAGAGSGAGLYALPGTPCRPAPKPAPAAQIHHLFQICVSLLMLARLVYAQCLPYWKLRLPGRL